jgi:hypothetical protein
MYLVENYSADYENSTTSLELRVPRFTYGEGSLIRVKILIENKLDLTSSDYIAYATYDQGSYKKVLPIIKKPPPSLAELLSTLFNNFWRAYGGYLSLIGGILVAIVPTSIFDRLRKRRKGYKNDLI